MSISRVFKRFAEYLRRHGFQATISRARIATRRALTAHRKVLFYYDLTQQLRSAAPLPSNISVERKATATDLNAQDLIDVLSVWNPVLARRNMETRFSLGASLWLIKIDGQLAGYGWTLRGQTVEPHYFPLGQD